MGIGGCVFMIHGVPKFQVKGLKAFFPSLRIAREYLVRWDGAFVGRFSSLVRVWYRLRTNLRDVLIGQV